MELNKNAFPKKQKSIPPQGITLGVCYSIIDLGTQQEQFPGKPVQSIRKLHFSFELPSLPAVVFDDKKGPQIQALFHEYTASLDEKANLAKVLLSWGQMKQEQLKPITSQTFAPFIKNFLGQACMINVAHNVAKAAVDEVTGQKLVYANIGQGGLSIMPRMTEIAKPTGTINSAKFLDLDAFDWNVYLSLPNFLQEKIAKSKEWSGILVKYPKPATVATQDMGQPNQGAQPAFQAPPQQQNQMADHGTVYVGTPTGGPAF